MEIQCHDFFNDFECTLMADSAVRILIVVIKVNMFRLRRYSDCLRAG
jgi:hypothetical protein